ncbi:receptor transporting protein [Echinococcus multilocularis]|uniref:Receptor transporting protein n=1 Tax=Echinococcus multilocularis TaxID=6211 RepID=A0A0S4MLP9_ECHMU|nr:receptor transporting protein [Echinococcus multilocularis]
MFICCWQYGEARFCWDILASAVAPWLGSTVPRILACKVIAHNFVHTEEQRTLAGAKSTSISNRRRGRRASELASDNYYLVWYQQNP